MEQPSDRTHICGGCGSREDVGYLVDATIAALQARVKELEQWVQDQSTANLETMRHMDEMQSRALEAESQLTQRTAELEAANTLLYKKNCALGRAETSINDLVAELERVRGERDEANELVAALSSKVAEYEVELNGDPQNFYGRGRTVGLRTLILALPKVEGEINERFCTGSYYSSPRDYRTHVTFEAALVALLKHRQGMEG